jgi:hypothetical protein
MAYHYYLELARKRMEVEKQELIECKKKADESSARRAALSASAGRSTAHMPVQPPKLKSRINLLSDDSCKKNLESELMEIHDEGNVIPKTPEAALLALATYLQSTQPMDDDPRVTI